MSAVLTCLDLSKPHTYQHIHGTMLINLNKIAVENNLSHTDYRLMGILIGLWNKEKGMAFPTIDYLSSHCKMSKSTILRSLKRLITLELIIIKKQKGRRNNYYLSETLFKINTHKKSSPVIPLLSTPCDTSHDKEQNRIKLKRKSSKNDDLINTLKILKKWSVINPQKIILKYKLEKVLNLIEITKQHNPHNPGAYFRTLLNNSDTKQHFQKQSVKIESEPSLIKQMLKYQYWKHKPSGQQLKIKPDIGSHLFINYIQQTNFVHILQNETFSDILTNFEPVQQPLVDKLNEITRSFSKKDLLIQFVKEGRLDEAIQLSRIYNLRSEFQEIKRKFGA